MARRRREVKTSGDDYHRRQPNSPADKPKLQFFKVILPCTLTEKKLMIPIKFVRRFGDELSDVANFITPNGCNWKVSMRKDQNDIWFDDGWHDFVQHHSIDIGYFLIFAYRGFSNFSVGIFDPTACEIEYTENAGSPFDGESQPVPNCEDVEIDTTEMLEFANVSPESKSAIHAARKYKPISPSCIVLLPSGNLNMLNFPTGFSNKYLRGARRYVKLAISDGRVWTICLRKSRKCAAVGKGWNAFCRENSLKTGDVCVFELTTRNLMLKASIFRAIQRHKDNSRDSFKRCKEKDVLNENDEIESEKTSLENGKAMQAWKNFRTEMRSFKILMQPYQFKHSIVHLPSTFRTTLKQAPEFVNLQTSNGQEWSVGLKKHVSKAKGKHDRFRLGSGWCEFRDENNLKIKDVCGVEIMNDHVWKVTIFRD